MIHPRCIVCTKAIPSSRPLSRFEATCSPECHLAIKEFKKANLAARKCPVCLHPSTPEERRQFREWRKKRNVGRPPTTLVMRLRTALAEAAKLLDDGKHEEIVRRMKKLVDAEGVKRDTLHASSNASNEENADGIVG